MFLSDLFLNLKDYSKNKSLLMTLPTASLDVYNELPRFTFLTTKIQFSGLGS